MQEHVKKTPQRDRKSYNTYGNISQQEQSSFCITKMCTCLVKHAFLAISCNIKP